MNPIFLDLGIIQIKWYSLLILIAILLGYMLIINRCKKEDIPVTRISDMFFYLVIVCILGARIYYCIFEWQYYSKNIIEVFEIWNGGLAIHGGVIAGMIFIYFYAKKYELKFLKLLDIFAPALVLGQAIGRWGNFFNQEAYGPLTNLIELKSLHIPKFVIDGMYINGAYHHPTFFYESLGCILIFITIILIRHFIKLKEGQITSIYFIGYGILRFFIESLRQDSLMFLNLKIAQIVSIIMILSGIIILICSLKTRKI